jgi:hypothetical protein
VTDQTEGKQRNGTIQESPYRAWRNHKGQPAIMKTICDIQIKENKTMMKTETLHLTREWDKTVA